MLKCLILIPTEYEAAFLRPALETVLVTEGVQAKLCGFGPIASGIRTAQLIAEFRPASCLLLGIAGTYASRLAIGSAYAFREVSCYGVGAGSGSEFKSASELGWQQWPDSLPSVAGVVPSVAGVVPNSGFSPNSGFPLLVKDNSEYLSTVENNSECFSGVEDNSGHFSGVENNSEILSGVGDNSGHTGGVLQLLTVTAASASQRDVDYRLQHFPNAAAEDMEGFSVALACIASNVPLTIIRGISNRAGERDKSKWAVKPALDAVAELANAFLNSERSRFS